MIYKICQAWNRKTEKPGKTEKGKTNISIKGFWQLQIIKGHK